MFALRRKRLRFKLSSTDHKALDEVCKQIVEVAKKAKVKVSGPIPLPTKILRVVTRKSPCGEGTPTFDHWEMRIHRRIVIVDADERVMRQILRIRVPENVHVEIKLV